MEQVPTLEPVTGKIDDMNETYVKLFRTYSLSNNTVPSTIILPNLIISSCMQALYTSVTANTCAWPFAKQANSLAIHLHGKTPSTCTI